ncbi:MAG TPA: sigma-70 family RNA polymerase sigma factor [Opitutus sp.]|nr:sigma-70 family RNA polymerase sigma factor [Opitutus sp.]
MLNVPENDCWFRDEVQIYENALRTWLAGKFPALVDVDNVIQEALMRVWRAHTTTAIQSPRALLFAAAHNLAIDQLRRQNIVPMDSLAEIGDLTVIEESPTPSEIAARNQELELLTKAIQCLPEKCRQVLTLRKIYGLSQKEIARQLGISEHTVEAQVGNGIRRCAAFFERLGLP